MWESKGGTRPTALSRGAVIKKNHLKKYPQDYIKENEEDLRKLFPPRKKSVGFLEGVESRRQQGIGSIH